MLDSAKKKLSWKAPTDSTIGQSARLGHCSRRSAASRTKALIAERPARPAASQIGVAAESPILMTGQVRPNRTTASPSWR
ncbi:MAG: hypothetical protein HYX38_04585 [Rhodospirillales bacterium]|nr:hypothetical protein [Rhodospirillales bacterium]